jgi:hypothetical protein
VSGESGVATVAVNGGFEELGVEAGFHNLKIVPDKCGMVNGIERPLAVKRIILGYYGLVVPFHREELARDVDG